MSVVACGGRGRGPIGEKLAAVVRLRRLKGVALNRIYAEGDAVMRGEVPS